MNSNSTIEKKKSVLGLSNIQFVFLFVILCLGLFLRIGMVDMVDETVALRNDALEYYSYAVNLINSDTYSKELPLILSGSDNPIIPDSVRPPGYVAFLYPFIEAPPTEGMINSIRFFQALLSTLTVFLTFLIFQFVLSNKWALMTTGLVSISPHLVSMNIYILSESLFTFFIILFTYLTIRAYQANVLFLTLISGLVLGAAMLTKPSLSYFIFIFIPLLLLRRRTSSDCIFIAVLFLGYMLIQLPWMVRNMTLDSVAAEKSKSLISLQNGSYPGLMYNDDPASRGIPHRADPNYGDIQSYGDFIGDVANKVADNPLKYLHWYTVGKIKMMLSWEMVAGAGDIYVYPVGYSPYYDRQPFLMTHKIMKAIDPYIMVLALFGLGLALLRPGTEIEGRGRLMAITVIAALPLYYILLHLLVTPLPRYMIPLRPLLYGLVLYGGVQAVDFIKVRFKQRQGETV